jgi:hypothetical protein
MVWEAHQKGANMAAQYLANAAIKQSLEQI